MLSKTDIQSVINAIKDASFVQEIGAGVKYNTKIIQQNNKAIDTLARMAAVRFDQIEERISFVEKGLKSVEFGLMELKKEVHDISNHQNSQDVILERNTDDLLILKAKFL